MRGFAVFGVRAGETVAQFHLLFLEHISTHKSKPSGANLIFKNTRNEQTNPIIQTQTSIQTDNTVTQTRANQNECLQMRLSQKVNKCTWTQK